MKKVIIFGGTTEGRQLAETLARAGVGSVYCAATEYGKQQVEQSDFIQPRIGRMDWQEMAKLFREVNPDAIVDATHPFAEVVKTEIENALFDYGQVPFYRVTRDEEDIDYSNCSFFDNSKDCANALVNTTGTVFLTTGSKELEVFCQNESLRERIIARVIPSEESLKICSDNGLKGKQIIAMQGPFSAGMNLAMLRECDAKIMVLKEGGKSSGEAARIIAANKANVKCFVIKRPEEKIKGYSLYMVKEKLFEELGIKAVEPHSDITPDVKIHVTLAGFGMGFGTVTDEVQQAMVEADYIFGAPRMLFGLETDSKKYPYYLAKDILPKLDEISENITVGTKRALVLLSGDTGFFSGAANLKKALEEKGKYKVKILPGISSISSLAAKVGESWQDSKLVSTHGIDEDIWVPKLIDYVCHNEKVFALTSGSKDIRLIGEILQNLEGDGARRFAVYIGTNMYADEKISKLTSDKCANYNEDGLSTILIKNAKIELKRLAPGMSDEEFIRDKVPMSKEEIRALSICKLGVTENAVCFDIGSGSGSVAVEMARLDSSVRVYAIELKDEACALTQTNIDKFNLKNVKLIKGTAPEALEGLPAPTHVFIGGSGGRLDEILKTLQAYNKSIGVVINAVTMETVSEIMQVIKKYDLHDVDITQVAVNKTKHAGEYNILQGQNPVFIVAFSL